MWSIPQISNIVSNTQVPKEVVLMALWMAICCLVQPLKIKSQKQAKVKDISVIRSNTQLTEDLDHNINSLR